MTRQTWTAVAAAVCFVALALVLAVVPVPYVVWSPGGVRDTLGEINGEPVVSVSDVPTYPTTGSLDLTIISVTAADSRLTLPQAVAAYFLPDRDVLPRDAVYAPAQSAADVEREEAELMQGAEDEASVAALRAAGQPVEELPVVASVTASGPAQGRLLPGDLVALVDGLPVQTSKQVSDLVRDRAVGTPVDFVVLRDRVRTQVRVTTAQSPSQPGAAVVGISLGRGYHYEPTISFELGRQIGGPSAGLVFALAIYDKITPGSLLDGRRVAGTGTIDVNGRVGAVGGIHQKIAAAEEAGATDFLVPAANCGDLAGVRTDLTLVKVSSLGEAVAALSRPSTSATAVPRC